jgi:hypothetical protein
MIPSTLEAQMEATMHRIPPPPNLLHPTDVMPHYDPAEADVRADATRLDDWEPYGTSPDPAHDLPTLTTWHWVEAFCLVAVVVALALKVWFGL